jgi:predicted PurR-regulated permease PerM
MSTLVLFSFLSIALLAALAAVWQQVRILNKRFAAMGDTTTATVDRIVSGVCDRMKAGENTNIDRVAKSVEDIRQDFEWLVSDRMIEQAIEIARTEKSPEKIRRIGMSEDEIAAAMMFRKH